MHLTPAPRLLIKTNSLIEWLLISHEKKSILFNNTNLKAGSHALLLSDDFILLPSSLAGLEHYRLLVLPHAVRLRTSDGESQRVPNTVTAFFRVQTWLYHYGLMILDWGWTRTALPNDCTGEVVTPWRHSCLFLFISRRYDNTGRSELPVKTRF